MAIKKTIEKTAPGAREAPRKSSAPKAPARAAKVSKKPTLRELERASDRATKRLLASCNCPAKCTEADCGRACTLPGDHVHGHFCASGHFFQV